jgi:hypothetical protein
MSIGARAASHTRETSTLHIRWPPTNFLFETRSKRVHEQRQTTFSVVCPMWLASLRPALHRLPITNLLEGHAPSWPCCWRATLRRGRAVGGPRSVVAVPLEGHAPSWPCRWRATLRRGRAAEVGRAGPARRRCKCGWPFMAVSVSVTLQFLATKTSTPQGGTSRRQRRHQESAAFTVFFHHGLHRER